MKLFSLFVIAGSVLLGKGDAASVYREVAEAGVRNTAVSIE